MEMNLDKHIINYNKQRKIKDADSLCYAPSKSLFFRKNGDIGVCCNNREYVLGKYPQDNIASILNGDKLSKLKNSLKNNDFSLGCDLCKQQIINGNYANCVANYYDDLPLFENIPSILEFELDNICNLECEMCFGKFSSLIEKNREEKAASKCLYDKTFIEQITPYLSNLRKTTFLGGEPFLIDIYYEIWEKLIEVNPNCEIFVQTNGTILNPKIKKLLEKGNFDLNISLDSLIPEVYKRIRQNASLSTVLANLDYFLEYAKQKNKIIGCSVCILRENINEIPSLMKFCSENNMYVYFNMVSYPIQFSLDYLSSAYLKQLIEMLESYQAIPTNELENRNLKHYNGLISHFKQREIFMMNHENILSEKISIIDIENQQASELLQEFEKKIQCFIKTLEPNLSEKFINANGLYKLNNALQNQSSDFPLYRVIKYIIEKISIEVIVDDLIKEPLDVIQEKIRVISFDVI